jgi:hypothetical protein
MSEKNPFKLFVAHEFTENVEYSRVFEYLESRDNFFYLNYSDPEAVEPGSGQDAMQDAIREQIKHVEVVIIPGGMLKGSAPLVEFEMKVAQAFDKPIVLIQPFGATMSIPKEAMEAAADIVEWNDRVLTDAIRHVARGEDTAQWDVIEFDMDEFKVDDD